MATPHPSPGAYIVLDEGSAPVVAGGALSGCVELARRPRSVDTLRFAWIWRFLARRGAAAQASAAALAQGEACTEGGRHDPTRAASSLRFSLPVPLWLTTHHGAALARTVSLRATITGDPSTAVELPLDVHAARLAAVPHFQAADRTALHTNESGGDGARPSRRAEALGPYRTASIVTAAGDRLPATLLRALAAHPTLAHTARYELARPSPRALGSEPSVRWACLGGTAAVDATCGEGCAGSSMGATWKVVCRLWNLRALARADGAGRPLAEDSIPMTLDAVAGVFCAPLSADLPPTVVLPDHAVLWSTVLQGRGGAPLGDWPLFVVPFRTDAYGTDVDRAPGSRRRALLAALQRAR